MTVRACMSALPVVIQARAKDDIYKIYLTDAIKTLCENSAKMSGGAYIKARYVDLIAEKKDDPRTSKEIISGISEMLAKIGGEA